MKKVFVTDGRSLAALAIVRSLGEKGIEVHCGEEFVHNITFYSKYVTKKKKYPNPENEEEFITYLLQQLEQENYDLVIPVRDTITELMSKFKKEIEVFSKVFVADFQKISMLGDKGETVRLARKCNVPHPKTFFPEDQSLQEICDGIKFPALVRPRKSSGSRGIEHVINADELLIAYEKVKREYGIPIIQEYISHEGGHFSLATLFDENSEPVAVHVYRETKQYPIHGGPAINAITVDIPEWVQQYLSMLKSIQWIGPAHMDILFDPTDNSPKLLEVNPRFWMSLNLTIKSGLDIPYMMYKLSVDRERIKNSGQYKTGMKYRWIFPNEILWILQNKNYCRDISDFVHFDKTDLCYSTFSKEDPIPVLGMVMQGMHFITNSEKRKFFFNRGW